MLTPVDLDALEVRDTELDLPTDVCKLSHIEHERPLLFHELISGSSVSSSSVGNNDGARSLSSLFADPERILRRLYVFAEEPCKSTITTSEPCSPVFKEAQPRPSEQSISLISRIQIFVNFIVHNVFLLLVV